MSITHVIFEQKTEEKTVTIRNKKNTISLAVQEMICQIENMFNETILRAGNDKKKESRKL